MQRMREEYWETEPHYGGDRGEPCVRAGQATPGWLGAEESGVCCRAWWKQHNSPANKHPNTCCALLPAVIWEALRAACEADLETARIILDSAGVIVAAVDMTICYDERGRKYELPRFVTCDPTNLSRDPGGGSGRKSGSGRGGSGNGAQLELPAVAAGGSGGGGGGGGGSPDAPNPVLDTAPLNQLAER